MNKLKLNSITDRGGSMTQETARAKNNGSMVP